MTISMTLSMCDFLLESCQLTRFADFVELCETARASELSAIDKGEAHGEMVEDEPTQQNPDSMRTP